jgi:polyhydroxybutyrate depolymerase
MLVMAVASPMLAAADSKTPIETTFEFDGRPVKLILPKNFAKGNDLIPLVIHLHGALPFDNAPDLELEASGYPDLPGKYRVMVAAPRASLDPTLGLYVWNSFSSLVGCGHLNADDVGFLNGLLDKLIAEYPVDPQRVYIYGYSAGGWMAHRMACVNAERFAGIVSGAGAVQGDPQLCAPSVPISVLQFHSKGDEGVLFDGGNAGWFFNIDPGNPACDYPGAVELLTRWADLNGCRGELKFGKKPKFDLTTPGAVELPGGVILTGGVEGKDTTVNKFQRCPPGIDVELWSMEEGVPHPPLFFHVGPNGIKTLAEKSWQFLRKHTRGDDNDDDDDDIESTHRRQRQSRPPARWWDDHRRPEWEYRPLVRWDGRPW